MKQQTRDARHVNPPQAAVVADDTRCTLPPRNAGTRIAGLSPAVFLIDQFDLQREVKDALLRLVRKGRLVREKVAGGYVYGSANESRRRAQFASRRRRDDSAQPLPDSPPDTESTDEVKAAIVLFVSLLDEKHRRLYAGLEALKFGPRHRQTKLLPRQRPGDHLHVNNAGTATLVRQRNTRPCT